jgi:hypothetical protein
MDNCKMVVGFEVLTEVIMKNAVFWDVAPCGFIINRHFGGKCRLHLQGKVDTFLRNISFLR